MNVVWFYVCGIKIMRGNIVLVSIPYNVQETGTGSRMVEEKTNLDGVFT